ncbi:uncharacterized protein LOC119563579 isoform X1 [Chelonia mydas]|uniref:uncharacterized protein LOC119563579 isoform X1 n=1 Tax=Chelonia mydas TaxID=8469 RepID=UPI001CA8A230|nr:uncharacterized protein LOC119563579 isoform X1 [Chelonia mydas]
MQDRLVGCPHQMRQIVPLPVLYALDLVCPTQMDPTRMNTTRMDTRMDPTRMVTTRMDTHMDPRCPVDLDALPLLGVIPQVALMGIIKSRSIRSMAMVIMDTSMEVDRAAVLTRIKKAPPAGLAHIGGTSAAEANYSLRTSVSWLQFAFPLPFASSSK